jgi:hypothetical protein
VQVTQPKLGSSPKMSCNFRKDCSWLILLVLLR